MLVDVHAHMEHPLFKNDLKEVLARAEQAGVKTIISSGTNPHLNIKTLELAKQFQIIKPALGIYPTDGLVLSDKEFDDALQFIRNNKKNMIAIGEIGLDFQEAKDKAKEQEHNFLKLLGLAEELNLPVIIHSRKAEERVIAALESSKLKKIVLHCFSGNMNLIKRAEANGWMFSIPCNITMSSHFQSLVKQVSMNQLLTETDAPFLPPVKGERNEPKNVSQTISKICEIKCLDREEAENMIFMNFQKTF
ncbi:TatD family deoxyribonuclease [Candidatus Woesearchaeota archaeon]|nr:TatD family deoxyribonuclease [Candidatus Woesearchaeota archaeon]